MDHRTPNVGVSSELSPAAMGTSRRYAWMGALRAMRPHQWVKNAFVLVPLVFAKAVFRDGSALLALGACASFCLCSSSVYVVNDIADVDSDRMHPAKCHRPIASGILSVQAAKALALALLVSSLLTAFAVRPGVAYVVAVYATLNLAYTKILKRIPYVDVLSIAAGFLLRVVAGALAIRVPASGYLLVVTFALACLLGFGKRAHEMGRGEDASKGRAVLGRYDPATLAAWMNLSGVVTIVVYVIYALDARTRAEFGTNCLVLTTPFAAFGVWRFLTLVRDGRNADGPTEQILRDRPFVANFVTWSVVTMCLIYAR